MRFDLAGTTVNGKFSERMRSRLKGEYSGQSRVLNSLKINVQQSDSEPPVVNQTNAEDRLQLFDHTGTRLVGFAPDVLSVHMLAPYHDPNFGEPSGWAEFRPRICAALDVYWAVAQPVGAIRASLRYINKIVLPKQSMSIQDILTCAISTVPELPDVVTNFFSRVDYRFQDGTILALSQGSTQPSDSQASFFLDIDVIYDFPRPFELDQVTSKLDDLRELERQAFEASITDSARGLFDETSS